MTNFDVFLCHNSEDKPAIKQIANQLKELGIRPWLDEWELRPGQSWQWVLEQQIEQIASAAVFVGSAGLGPWQREEIYAFLQEFQQRSCPVIPVLLSNAPQQPRLPVFLRNKMWVDFRKLDPEPIGHLVWGITGEKPETQLKIQHTSFKTQGTSSNNALDLLNSHLGVQPDTSAVHAKEILNPHPDIQPTPVTDDLSSERGIDYTRLRDLLAAQEWEQADQETYRVMIKVLGKNTGHIFAPEEMRSFPCTDLQTIDNLWVKHSGGRFGFSIQKKIYLSVGGLLDGDFYQDIWRKFGDKIGWRVNEIWICGCDEDEEINFDISSPEGHLPVVSGKLEGKVIVLFFRIEACKL